MGQAEIISALSSNATELVGVWAPNTYTLEAALEKGFDELDGFFTFLMGTKNELALVRDAFACKPAVVAETDDYVAISSEFRSLAKLPDVKHATLFEPKPEEMYVWRV